jgi:hypothetical protein
MHFQILLLEELRSGTVLVFIAERSSLSILKASRVLMNDLECELYDGEGAQPARPAN